MPPSNTWVVYQSPDGSRGVCQRHEWAAMELRAPGAKQLLHADIESEGVAERLARGTSGDPVPRTTSKPPPITPAE